MIVSWDDQRDNSSGVNWTPFLAFVLKFNHLAQLRSLARDIVSFPPATAVKKAYPSMLIQRLLIFWLDMVRCNKLCQIGKSKHSNQNQLKSSIRQLPGSSSISILSSMSMSYLAVISKSRFCWWKTDKKYHYL